METMEKSTWRIEKNVMLEAGLIESQDAMCGENRSARGPRRNPTDRKERVNKTGWKDPGGEGRV